MKSKMIERKFTKVYFRIFPTENMVWDYVKILDDEKTVYVRCLQELNKFKEVIVPTFWTFKTDQIFFNNSQKEIYKCVAADVLPNLTQGLDGIILGYGQTGTGKSLTISGLHSHFHSRGILPRVISDLFQIKKDLTTGNNIKMTIQMSLVEISRTNVYDLLKPYSNLVTSLKEITKIKVKNEDEALKLIFRGEGRREYSEESPYPSHTRSSICTFFVTIKNRDLQEHQIRQSKLHIIDLAGADTVGNLSCLFKKPRDIGSGNLAKTQLEQFFMILCTHIPAYIKIKQRLNPMIQYLGDSLSNSSILRLIGHIKVSREDLLITISMLRFGELIGGLKACKYEINLDKKEINENKIEQLQYELDKFKKEKLYDSIINGQNLSTSLDEQRYAHVQRTINEYLKDKIKELTIINVCELNIAFETLKMLYKQKEEEIKKNALLSVPSKVISPKRATSSYGTMLSTKTSRSLNKNSLENQSKQLKRNHSASGTVKSNVESAQLVKDSQSLTKSKASSSSLLRKSSSAKGRSQSIISKEGKLRSRSDIHLVPDEIPPEFDQAWNYYVSERKEKYDNFVELYEKNKLETKIAYKNYMNAVDEVKDVTENVEKIKNDLFLMKITRRLESLQKRQGFTSDYEKCGTEQMRKIEKELDEKREIMLRTQAELKIRINYCKKIKKDLKHDFDQYCREKYQMPLVETLPHDEVFLTNIEDILEEEDDGLAETHVAVTDNSEVGKFKELQLLIEHERNKKKLYQLRHKEWTMY